MDRQKIVLEAAKGITFRISEGPGGTLVIKAQYGGTTTESVSPVSVYQSLPAVMAGQYAEELSVYTDEYGSKAVILPGWTVSGVNTENTIWEDGMSLVIYRIPKENGSIDWDNPQEVERMQRSYSQLVWVPVSRLTPDGTLDGEHFIEKFGRRNYLGDIFSPDAFNEPLDVAFREKMESVTKYGGFYISRYSISKDSEDVPQSVKGCMPWVDINYAEAILWASLFERRDGVQSHLPFGAEYDSVLQWLLDSGCVDREMVEKDSTCWGNYENSKKSPMKVMETGSREEWSANNMYDLAGNIEEWTQERYGDFMFVSRGGMFDDYGYIGVAACRCREYSSSHYECQGFRVAIYIE